MPNIRERFWFGLVAVGIGISGPVSSAHSQQQMPTVSAPKAGSNEAIQTVVAQGLGKDVESAAKNAAENALIQVVGTFVQLDKVLNKRSEHNNGIRQESRSIDTVIREYSQGSIKSFEVLDTSQDNGLFRVYARVEVRIEDFKAFVAKLAGGETSLGPSVLAPYVTRAKNRENARDILVHDVLIPLIEGSAVQFVVGKPVIYDEWKRNLSAFDQHFVGGMLPRYLTSTTMVVPIDVKINEAFLANVRQSFQSIASEKQRVENNNARDLEHLCREVWINTPDDLPVAIIGSSSTLSDVYVIKDVRSKAVSTPDNPNDSHEGKLIAQLENEGFHSSQQAFAVSKMDPFRKLFPKFVVTLYGAEDSVVEETILDDAAFVSGGSNADRSVFTDRDWNVVGGLAYNCLGLFPFRTINLFMNLKQENVANVKRISVNLSNN